LSEQSKPKEVVKAQLEMEESSKTKDENTSVSSVGAQPAPSQIFQLSQVD